MPVILQHISMSRCGCLWSDLGRLVAWSLARMRETCVLAGLGEMKRGTASLVAPVLPVQSTGDKPGGVSVRDRRLPAVTANLEQYTDVLDAFPDTESLTVLLVAGSSRAQVAEALGLDLSAPAPEEDELTDFESTTSWAVLEVPGGVLAAEPSGFGDPTLAALAAVSRNGGSAAVVRSNILAHVRFGCARDGSVLFDDNEYMFVQDPQVVPAELRELFDLVWEDLSQDRDDDEFDGPDGCTVGLAMAAALTGLEVTPEQVTELQGSGFFSAPTLVYVNEFTDEVPESRA